MNFYTLIPECYWARVQTRAVSCFLPQDSVMSGTKHFFFNKFILFIFGCVVSSLLRAGFL